MITSVGEFKTLATRSLLVVRLHTGQENPLFRLKRERRVEWLVCILADTLLLVERTVPHSYSRM